MDIEEVRWQAKKLQLMLADKRNLGHKNMYGNWSFPRCRQARIRTLNEYNNILKQNGYEEIKVE